MPLILDGVSLARLALAAAAALYVFTVLLWSRLPNEPFTPKPGTGQRSIRRELWALLVLLTTATVLRLGNITASFWWDELGTVVRLVRRGVPTIIALSANGNNHMLNSLLALGATRIFGESEWAARIPALLFGILTPPVVYWLALRVFPRSAAFGLGLLFAVHFRCVVHSAEARGYSGSLLFGIIGCFLFYSLWSGFRRSTAIAYVLSVAAATGFLFLSIFVPIAHGIAAGTWALYAFGTRTRRRPLPLRLGPLLASVWGALAGLMLNAIQLPQLVRYSHTTYDHIQMGWTLLSSTFLYLSGGSNVAVACLVLLCALGGWMRRYNDIGLVISLLFPGLFIITAFTLARVPASPRLFSILILPALVGVVLFVHSAWKNGTALTKVISGAVVVLLIADSLPVFVKYYAIGNPPLRQVALRIRNRPIWLVGAQSESNRYYFPHAVEFRSEQEAAASGTRAPDFVLTTVKCVDIRTPVQLESAGFHRIQELPDWTISEPLTNRHPCYVLLGR